MIAIDVRPAPLEIAKQFGATHTQWRGRDTAVDAVRDLTAGRGVDFVFDTVGLQRTLNDALACARKGGTVVLTGLAAHRHAGGLSDVSIRDAGEAGDWVGVRIRAAVARYPAT